jgi:hypothetical protein
VIQKVQLTKSTRDAAIDIMSLGLFVTMVYFVMNPDAYERVTEAAANKLEKLTHRLSVWQTKLSIRSLPETDDE